MNYVRSLLRNSALNNSNGISLVAVLTIAILLVVILVGGVQAIATANLFGINAINTETANLMQSELASMLTNEYSCRMALGGPATYGSPTIHGIQSMPTPTIVDNETSGELFILNPDHTSKFLSSADNTVPAGQFGNLMVCSITIQIKEANPIYAPQPVVPPSGPIGKTRYHGVLTVKLQRGTCATGGVSGLLGSQTMARQTDLWVELADSTGTIDSCTALGFGAAIDAAPAPLPPSCKPGEGLWSNGTTITCVRIVCPVGTSGNTFDSNGKRQCS